MNRRLPALMLLLLPGAPVLAATSLTAGADYWNYRIDGTVRYQSQNPADNIDVRRDLGYNDGSLGSYYLQVQHPLPVLPNVRLARTDIDESADGRLSRSVTFGQGNYQVNEDVTSSVRFNQTDVILYYNLLDTEVHLDLGLDARYIDSEVHLNGQFTGSQTATASGWIPMLYGSAAVDLPLTGFTVGARGAVASYQGDRLYDFNLGVRYTSRLHLGAELGYRRFGLRLDDFDSTWADITFDGPSAGVFVTF